MGKRTMRAWVVVVVTYGMLAVVVPSRAADKSAKCAAAKLAAAGKYAACRLAADAKATKTGTAANYTKCGTKFLKSFARAESKAGPGICPSEGNQDLVSSCLDEATSQCATSVKGCDGTGDCGTCSGCAQGVGGPCQSAADACLQDADCVALANCATPCGDQTCIDQCTAQHPNGASLYAAAVTCIICNACPTDCDAASSGCPQ